MDIGVSSASSTLNEKSEIDNEIVDHVTNADLKSLRIRNLNKIVTGHLNINWSRIKFDFLAHQGKENIDILIILKIHFLLDGYSTPFRFDRNDNGVWYFIIYYRRYTIPILSMNKNIEGFFVEIKFRKNKKELLSCSYNQTKMLL